MTRRSNPDFDSFSKNRFFLCPQPVSRAAGNDVRIPDITYFAKAEPMNINLSDLTLVGWLHTLVTIVVVVGLMLVSGQIYHHELPAGQYPVALLIAPGLLVAGIYFAIGSLILRRFGLPVVRQR
jgi:hypothetical protein